MAAKAGRASGLYSLVTGQGWLRWVLGDMNATQSKEIILTTANVAMFPKFKQLLDDGKIVADSTGRLRYKHGAPVGRLILMRVLKDGTPKYAESTAEWFDPESQRAREFVWP